MLVEPLYPGRYRLLIHDAAGSITCKSTMRLCCDLVHFASIRSHIMSSNKDDTWFAPSMKTDVPWYYKEPESVNEATRKLLIEYSGIPEDKVVEHTIEVVSILCYLVIESEL